jgi:hypothetical protein
MNNKIINKLPGILLTSLMLLSLVFVGLVWFGPLGEPMLPLDGGTPMEVPVYTNTLLVWIYIMLGFTAVVTVVLAIVKFAKNFIANPKNAIKPLVVIFGLLVIFGVSWSFGSQEKMHIFGYPGTENEGIMAQFIDMFLFTVYALFVIILLTVAMGRIITVIKLKK